jgi:hypothetical protein
MPRELIEPNKGKKRYVRRQKGKFSTRQSNVGRSLSADRRSKAKTIVKKGEGIAAISVPAETRSRGDRTLAGRRAMEAADRLFLKTYLERKFEERSVLF